jgi:hypothetical protein
MPRYYFHIRQGGQRIDDPEGSELQNHDAALREAQVAAHELIADRLRRGLSSDEAEFEVQDSAGEIIGKVPFPRTSD